jgi:hypothetical protein
MSKRIKPDKALGMQGLASYLTMQEAGKSQGKISDTRQQLHILSKRFYSSSPNLSKTDEAMLRQLCPQGYVIYKNGKRLAKGKKK